MSDELKKLQSEVRELERIETALWFVVTLAIFNAIAFGV